MRFNLSLIRTEPLLVSLWAVYLVFFVGGIGSHVLYGGTPQNMAWAAPFFLALASAIAFASAPSWWRPMATAAAIGFAAEVAGVQFGYPFGAYRYTDVLRPLVAGVPIVVAGAWMVLFAYVSQMRVHPALAAVWMTSIDLVIDPLASNDLGYWTWLRGGIYFGVPLINFAGWFAVCLIIFYVLRVRPPRSSSIQMLGRSVIFFFAAIAAAHHYLLPAFLGLALAALGYWRFRSVKVSTMT